jgi:hypothetical protein
MPRRHLDRYETPPHYVEQLLAYIGPLDGLTIYEPCVGAGHLARFLTAAAHLRTNDIVWHETNSYCLDARLAEAWPIEPDAYDWTITNPPFSDELAILQHALAHSRNVAFLARLTFLEPTLSRIGFWRQHPPTDVIVLPRYSFRLNDHGKRQTDSVTCCWLIWREGRAPCLSFSGERA